MMKTMVYTAKTRQTDTFSSDYFSVEQMSDGGCQFIKVAATPYCN